MAGVEEVKEVAAEAAVAAVVAEQAVENKMAEQAEVAAAVIESAQQRVENAEAVAQGIADAAMMTATGERLDAHVRECATWHARLEAMETKLSLLEASLAELALRLPPIVMTEPSSTSKPSTQFQPSKTEVVLAESPSDVDEDGRKDQETRPERKRRHVL